MRKLLLFVSLSVLIIPLLLSCRAEPLDPEQPNVVILSPGNGASLGAGGVEVRLFLEHFLVNTDFSSPNKIGEGHIMYYLDAVVPLKYGNPATSAPGTYVASTETSYTWPKVTAGQHTFTAQLVNNDNTPLLPPVAVRVDVNVR